jgi:FAD/FMN-containing dehydrogenase
MQVIEDGCVPLERLGDYISGLRRAAERHGIPVAIFGHAGDGHVHVNALPDTTRDGWRVALAGLYEESTALVQALGGTPSGEHGDGRLRAGVLARFFGTDLMQVFRDLKRAYDPLSIFNPGVIIPAADWEPLADVKVGPDATRIPEDIAARLRAVERAADWAVPKPSLAASPVPPAPNP